MMGMNGYVGDPGGTQNQETIWWKDDLSPKQRGERNCAAFKRTRVAQKWRLDQEERYAALYSKTPMFSATTNRSFRRTFGATPRAELNVVKSCADAFTSKMTMERPKATFLTTDADWETRQRAKRLERYSDAMRDELGIYDLAQRIVLDACVFGTGFIHPKLEKTHKGPRLAMERVFQSEITLDDREGYYGYPKTLYRSRWIDRDELVERIELANPEDVELKVQAIKRYRPADPDLQWIPVDSTADLVLTTESWRLPRIGGGPDGRHCLSIPEMELLYDPYPHSEHPFVAYRRQWGTAGIFGIGLAEELYGLQLQINTILQRLERCFHMMGSPHWLVPGGSQISGGHIDNAVGSLIRFTGAPPTALLPPIAQPEVYAHLQWLFSKCYEITGINEMTAQAQKPKGLNSGKAIDTFADIQSERFAVASYNYQKFHLDLTRWIVRLSDEACEVDSDFCARFANHKSRERIPFKEARMDEEDYVIRLYPTNALADDPAERIADVERMAQAGWIDGPSARRLLDFPDLAAAQSADDASYEAVQTCIEAAIERGDYKGPQPFFDLQSAVKQVNAALVQAWRDGVPEERQQLLRNWLVDAVSMQQPPPGALPAMPQPPPANMNGAAPPPAPPAQMQ